MKKPLDLRTLRFCYRVLENEKRWAKGKDDARRDPESKYWMGATDAYGASATRMRLEARRLEKRR